MIHQCKHCMYSWSSIYKPISCPYCGALQVEACTQKSKGLAALWAHRTSFSPIHVLHIRGLHKVKKELPTDIFNYLPSFVRPCPPTPEHGFVESRVVRTTEELEQLRLETLAANEDSELMLTNVFDKVDTNTLLTPGLLTVGPGNDGATAGKNTVSIPLVGNLYLPPALLGEAQIGPDQWPYFEAIKSGHDHYLTQIRSGPKLNSVEPDFVPSTIVVEDVIQTAGEDLLEWAKKVKVIAEKNAASEHKTVVWHPGGSLTDHYSVHCRENGVPIVLTFQPVIGLVLEPTSEIPPLDPHAIIKGLAVGDAIEMGSNTVSSDFIALALIALHNSAVMRGSHSFWIGLAVASILKLGSAALNGEARHAHNAWHGFKDKPNIYQHYGKKSLSFHRARLSRVTQLLHYGFGDPDTQPVSSGCGYGGRRWALCGAALAPLFNSVKRVCSDPTEENASKLLLDLNIAVNQAHNGGWWLNKFISVAAYTQIPQGQLMWYIQPSGTILNVAEAASKVDVDRFTTQVSTWPDETTISPLKWRKSSLVIDPGAVTIKLKASTLPNEKEIKIPLNANLMKSLIKGINLNIKPGLITMPHEGTELVLFKETKLEAVDRMTAKKE